MYNLLYSGFPRQISVPWRINVKNMTEFKNEVNKYNGRKRVFASVYNYHTLNGVGNYENVILDKVFFDFDGPSAYESIRTATTYLLGCGNRFTIFFSGGGFHLYIFVAFGSHIVDKKSCLTNMQMYFKDMLNLDLDRAVVGDLARVATIPNTYNIKRKKYCIPITTEDLDKGLDHIMTLADHQCNKLIVYGKEPLNAMEFDRPSNFESMMHTAYSNVHIDKELDIEGMPRCISVLLKRGYTVNVGWRGRFLIIMYLKSIGYMPSQIEEMLLLYLTNPYNGMTEAEHCINTKNQVNDIFKSNRYIFPKCDTIKQDGYCPANGYCDMTSKWGDEQRVVLYK